MSDNITKVRVTTVRGTYEVKWELLSMQKVLESLEMNNAGINSGPRHDR